MKRSSIAVLAIAAVIALTGLLLTINDSEPNAPGVVAAQPADADQPRPVPRTDPEVYQRSYELEAAGDYAGALAMLQRLTNKAQRQYMFHARRGWLYYMVGRYDESIAEYVRAVDDERKSMEAYLGLSAAHLAKLDYAATIAVCKIALQLDDDNYTALSRLAWCYLYTGEYRDAERAYKHLEDLYPSDLDVKINLGWSMYWQSDLKDAREKFEEVLMYAPENESATAGLQAIDG